MESIRVTELNILPLTRNKESIIDDFRDRYLDALNLTLNFLTFCQPMNDMELHGISYTSVRKETGLPAQIVQTARREVWSKEKVMFDVVFKRVSVRLTERDYRFRKTKRNNPVFAVTLFKGKRFALPIKKDGAWQRFNSFLDDGWNFKSIMLLEKNGSWVIQAILKKDFPEPIRGKSILGVDVGSVTLATISVTKDKRIIRQLYLGREVCHKQRKISDRRSKLQSLADKGSSRARKSLAKLKSYESNYTKTECFKTAWKIIKIAKQFNSSIAIEKLRNCRTRKGQFNKRANRKVNKIPYFKLFSAIKGIAIREQIEVIEVDPRNTSRTCYKCGNVSKSNRKTQAIFKCTCGHTCNADINASVNISHRAVDHAIQPIVCSDQMPMGRTAVNQSLRSNESLVVCS
jgi:putative transposase